MIKLPRQFTQQTLIKSSMVSSSEMKMLFFKFLCTQRSPQQSKPLRKNTGFTVSHLKFNTELLWSKQCGTGIKTDTTTNERELIFLKLSMTSWLIRVPTPFTGSLDNWISTNGRRKVGPQSTSYNMASKWNKDL